MNKFSKFLLTILTIILIGITVSSIIIIPDDSFDYTEEEINDIIEETFDEIVTYIQIKDKMGKYYGDPPKIEKIALLITPWVSSEIKVSSLTIKLNNGENVKLLSYCGYTDHQKSNSLFEHSIWNNITEDNFGFIIINDEDNALVDFGVINSNTDMVYVIFKLTDFSMNYKDTMLVTIFPSTGWEKTVKLTAPLPIDKVVML